jgi:raffinose/stachyose/melibiose transport system substrate-binding protein
MSRLSRPKTGLRPLAMVASASVAVGLLAGCGSSSTKSPAASSSKPAAGSSSSSGSGSSSSSGSSSAPLATSGTVNWWGWTPTNSALATAYITAFHKQYPNIKVNFKLVSIADWPAAIRPALLSGDGPDVFDMQPGAYVSEFGSFAEDLTPLAEEALGSDWKSKIAPIGISGLTNTDGKLTSLSVGSTYAGTLWINPTLFTKYSLKPPTTLAQWTQDCAVFKAHGQGCFVQGASQEGFDQDTLQSIANSVQPGLWTQASKGKAKWDSPGMLKTFSIWRQLFTDGIMQPGALGYQQYPDANNAFLTGKFAMVMMGTWYTQNVTVSGMTSALSAAGVASPKPFAMLPIHFPDVAGAGNTSEMYGDADYGLAVSTKSKNRGAADTFVKWLTTSTAGQQVVANALDDLPSLKTTEPDFSSVALVDPSVQKAPVEALVKSVGNVTEPREALLSADVQNDILAAATSVASGSATPQAALSKLQSAAAASSSGIP